MRNLALALIFFFPVWHTTAQTYVNGGIYNDVTWTKANSPYIVDGHIVVFDHVTLTIEPGVEVRVDSNKEFEIRGRLRAIGTPGDSIYFKANKPGVMWRGLIMFYNGAKQGGQATLNYVVASDAARLLNMDYAYAGPYYFNWCRFYNNKEVSYDVGTVNTFFNYCKVHNNDKGLEGSGNTDATISNCEFYENMEWGSKGGIIKNCHFHHHTALAVELPKVLEGSEINDNTIGVNAYCAAGIRIIDNNMHDNYRGIDIAVFFNEPSIVFKNNKICNNAEYNISYHHKNNADLTGNCFCSSDSAFIASKIYDGYDNVNLGLISYDTLNNCTQPSSINDNPEEVLVVRLYPQPFSGSFFIETPPGMRAGSRLTISDMFGRLIKSVPLEPGKQLVAAHTMPAGMYIYTVFSDGAAVATGRLVHMQ